MFSTWRDAAKSSRRSCIPWRRIVGRDLTAWLYMQFSQGATPEYCEKLLYNKLSRYYEMREISESFPLSAALKRVRSNVTARYAEFNRKPK